MRSPVLPGVLAMIALGGCGSLVDNDYAGQPLLRLRGMPQSTPLAMGADSFGAALRWEDLASDATAMSREPLEPDFPTFWIDVVAWPPERARLQLGSEPAFAEGYLHIVRADIGPQARIDDILATELSHVLIYAQEAIAPGSLTASYLGAAFAPGFHVVSRAATPGLSAAQAQLVERCVAQTGDTTAARATCTAQHLYQLAPTPADLETLLTFTVAP